MHRQTGPGRALLAALAVIAMLTLSSAPFALADQQGSPSQSSTGRWWNSQYSYMKSVTVANPSAAPLSNYPVFIPVTFPFSHLSDASAEVRLVTQAGAEVPSYVLDAVSSGGFVTSAWVLAFVTVPASSSAAFELYYGNPVATTPSYRVDSAAAGAQAGQLALDVSASQPEASSFQVTLGGTYSEQILSKVSYGAPVVQAYGAHGIAPSPAAVLSPLTLVANVSGSQVALSSVYSAGALRYTQAYVLDNGTLVVGVLLTNTAQAAVPAVSLTDLVDATSLAALGPLSTSYSPKTGLLSTGVSGAYFGYDSNLTASSYEVGDLAQVVSDASAGTLSNASSGAGAATALTWGLGTLAPGASFQLVSAWGVGGTPAALAGSLAGYADQPQATVGQEEAYSATPSQVTSAWNVAVPIPNASVSRGGLSIPVALDGAVPVSSSIRLAGTVSYTLPTGSGSLSNQKGWAPESAATGNVSAYSTTAFYSILEHSFTDSVRVTSSNGSGSGAAQLVSPVMSFPASVSKSLVVTYRALFSGSGDLSSQWLYVAVDVAQSPAGPFTQTFAVPAAGSSSSIAASGCESLFTSAVPVSPSTAAVASTAALVVDGAWRSLNVSLDGAFGTSASIYARIRFCAATTPGYTGQVELDVASAGLQARGDAPTFLSASVLPGSAGVTISFIPGATFEPSSLELDGMVTFPAIRSAPLVWNGGTSYEGTIDGLLAASPPTPRSNSTQNAASSAGTAAPSPLPNATLVGATISSQLYPLTPKVSVNGTSVSTQVVGNSLFLNSSDIVGNGGLFRVADLALTFAGHRLGINVEDANGAPLAGAGVTVQVNGSQPINESVTDSDGLLSLVLPPSTYSIAVMFQGLSVATTTAAVTADQNVTVPTTVYPLAVQVKDALGRSVRGADIAVASGSSDLALATDASGMATFLGVPGKDYNVTVSIADTTYYVGTVMGSSSRATFEFATSYLPPAIQEGIVGAIAAAMIVASLVVYFSRMRPRGDKASHAKELEP